MSVRRLILSRAMPWAVAGALGLVALASEMTPIALINETPSVPKGLYLRTLGAPPQLGDLVAVAQPPAARTYLAGMGVPPDMRLLKRVAATGGEEVCAHSGRLHTPRRTVAASRVDRRGAPLPAWQGCRRLCADEVLLLGDTPTSFDSRYFGPVRRRNLEGTYREVLRW